ncbi:E3 ubiquitin- ligase UBR4 [Paramuricea clavata]|uniref:E3 ubiquitin- ligase UBR4 n=1 Tax=Paramuricea clavata TaxID=317549 RepID=A0A6S7HL82_PARCT|nr:E3 ubiquitin- ligase UBR4 [Paramuricea clavata]CAB3995921.1 E3 ubiquitin- ligase UBR4 [Paramuricea clavata]
MMWSVWPELPAFGRKAAQFVDLLGYFTIKRSLSEEKAAEFSEKAIALLTKQNEILRNHANSNVYRLLSGLVDFDGFYLESDPCLVCNNPEVPYNNNKLSAIKADARFSTTSHMVKLVGSHNISKVTLRVTDVKRQKMVKTINLYYNNRSVQSVVELKNKTAVWQKAKKCHLIQGQTEVKIEFPLPIVACNLMIEYADFYENLQASSETLQCPRCSAPVPANPGVCGNCGENVYQCHKCRSINYDEKDPFLCNACGFCKYAKFDLTLTAKPCCAVDPIENEEDRKKAVTSINTLLDRADKMYRQLVAHRQPLDSLLMKIAEQGDNDFIKSETSHVSTSSVSGNAGGQTVNKSIQAVAQRYCVDCKGNFDELSKITQKVLASRKELIEYDTRVRDKITSSEGTQPRAPAKQLSTISDAQSVPGRCYGCSSAATEHCVTLLKALAMKPSTRDTLIKEGLIVELVNFTLYQGTCSIRNNVRDLLCLLTRNNPDAAAELNTILVDRVTKGMKEQSINPSVSSSISRDMQLLTKTVELEDSCWEQRLRCVTQIFLLSVQHVSPIVVQAVTLPCLKILSQFVKPKPATTKTNANKNIDEIASVKAQAAPIANMKDWIESQPEASYEEWERRATQTPGANGASLQETSDESVDDLNEEWLRNVMFSPSCGALRQVACSIVETVCQIPGRKRKIMDLLTSYLQGVGKAGENATEFFNLYSELMKPSLWKGYLATSGALLIIRDLIMNEIEQLTVLEETTLSSDLSQGYSLKRLTELMASFVEDKKIKQDFKGKLVGAVLNGYLSLRRLVVQRTKLVDQSQEILLNLLGELTSGTESETKEFMAICVNTLKRYELDDLRTPVFIFERLCNIIYPEENDTSEFLLLLEKDPQQEDFLQGRMQGNPYKSTDTGMGPLMRDVKNKICTDCDLIALLEDDTGMELLVNSKIISLDLPVKEVYKKIWCPQGEGEPMKVVYRMRGLLGDATEDIVEHLDKNNQKGVDNEIVYKMANVMNECGGLEAILKRLSGLRDLVRGRQLLEVILKLFGFCVKVKANRDYLAKPSLKTLKILLDVLNQILRVEQATPSGIGTMAEQILSIIETLLQGGGANMKLMIAAGQEEESQLEMLLEIIKTPYVRSNNNVLLSLMHILPFLTFGDKKSMNALIDHFEPYLNFEKFDKTHSDDELLFLECFCNIADGIENDENGNQLKNIIIDKGLVQQAVQYLELYTPSQAFSTSNLSDTDLWKEFLSRPSLPFILKFLSGMCKGHERSQLAVSETAVPTIHRLEQVSSEEKVGSLAENLMEALKEHPDAKTKVTAVRRETRLEKKKLAMAMRMKQLGALGMSATESGKIITKPSAVVQGFEEISNETGLTCCICREGYKYHPNKVLGIYTYTKRCILDSFELKQRKTQGYSTVSHFNIVHYECHVAAIRLARGRDEWESAALQNSNTKCNGLLPIWGPQVPESSFASCLARHNNYIQEATSHIEPTFHNTVHDMRLLLERFAFEKSFNEDSGGGGRQSNFNIIPYMVHMALYVMNTARIRSLEKSVTTFVEETHTTWIQSSFEVNGPLFMTVLSLFTHSLEEWKKIRMIFLSRLIVLAHVREVFPKGATKLSDGEVKAYTVYRPILIFFALVNKLHHMLKEHLSSTSSWSQDVASFIRNNDEKILKSCEELLSFYQDDLLPASSFSEFYDVAGLLGELGDPAKFMKDVFNSLPK